MSSSKRSHPRVCDMRRSTSMYMYSTSIRGHCEITFAALRQTQSLEPTNAINRPRPKNVQNIVSHAWL